MADDRDADRRLLEQAAEVLRRFSLAALTVKPRLDEPYPEAPQWTPWTRWMETDARCAHDLSVEIRRHLGIPHPFSRRLAEPAAKDDVPRT